MRIQELREDQTIIEWLNIINSRPNTERNYIIGMQWFTEWTGKDPESLLLEAEQEIREGILPRQRSIKKYLVGFRKHLQDRGLSSHTVNTHITGVKSYYQAFDIEIPKFTRASQKAQSLKQHISIPEKEDLQEVLKVSDPMEKAILLVGVSSGLSANEISNLRIRDFKKGYDPETGITTLDLRRQKVGFDFITFLSPEASKAVHDYLSYRARTDKKNELRRQQQLEKQKVFSDDNYLFIKRHIDNEFLETHNDELRKHDQASFVKLYRNLSEKALKNTPKGDWNIIRAHNMRKYFNSTMLNAGADSFHVEFFMGHTLDETRAAYFRASPEKLRDLYSKYIPMLTIAAEYDPEKDPNFQNLKQLSEAQARVIENTAEAQKNNRNELQELKAEMEKMKMKNEKFSELFKLILSDPEAKEKWDHAKRK